MTKPKKPSSHTVYMRGKICTSMKACDGATLLRTRIPKGVCGPCEEAEAKKVRVFEPRGIGYVKR
jgi:hypothetical protein